MLKKFRFSGLGLAGMIFLAVAAICLYIAITQSSPVIGLLAAILIYFGSDAMMFEISYIWTNGGLKERYVLWKKRRFWNHVRQREHLLTMLHTDARWFAHIPLADELTSRYIAALDQDWYNTNFESTDKMRQRLNLEPDYRVNKPVVVVYHRNFDDEARVQPIHSVHFVPKDVLDCDVYEYGKNIFENVRTAAINKDPMNNFGEWSFSITYQNQDTPNSVYF